MQVSEQSNVKIYNLSVGKSLPDWLSDRKRRALQKKDVEIRRRIELIQDFDMPGVSTSVQVSRDGQYILATGVYKPRIKCFEVKNLSLKFERCFDAEAVTFEALSEDYSKLVFLQCDRYLEFHSAQGRHYRLRIPKFGRDMKYHFPSCDLFVVGASSEIYRLNLERGQFMTPYTSTASGINKCVINPIHNLFVCGTEEGKVEAWDPRTKGLVGTVDCAFNCVTEDVEFEGVPSISALKFKDDITLGVGTATGQVLLYDIRVNKPFNIKDHMNKMPIKDVEFHYQQNLIYSMDPSVVKIWDQNTSKLFTEVAASSDFNNLCVVPNSGLFFIANESVKVQTYFIPSLGPAPRWVSFLDSLTEELEESNVETVYDDYKLVTKQELEALGLDHLIGTNLLRAYMHGYFIDIRLYRKAKSVADPFNLDEYRKKKVKDIVEKDRKNIVQVNKLPKVNKDLALKLMNDSTKSKNANKKSLLEDDRFKSLFENPDFEVNKNADEYRLLNPVLSRLDQSKKKELKRKQASSEFEPIEEKLAEKNVSDESSDEFYESNESEESSDDDQEWTNEMKKQHRLIQKEHRLKERLEAEKEGTLKQPELIELRDGEEFTGIRGLKRKANKAPLGERLESEDSTVRFLSSVGNREMTFSTRKDKRNKLMDLKNKEHRKERRQLARPAHGSKFKPKRNPLRKNF